MRTRRSALSALFVSMALLSMVVASGASTTPWTVDVTLSAPTGEGGSMAFGLDASATDGLDIGLGESDLPPGSFSSFAIQLTTGGSLIDLRPTSPAASVTWTLELNPVAADFPIGVSWTLPAGFPATGTIRLQDTEGGGLNLNMRAQSDYTLLNGDVDDLQIVYDPSGINNYDPPVVDNPVPAQTLTAGGGDFTLDLGAAPVVFSDPNSDALTYTAMTSDNAIALASVAGTILTVTTVAEGSATITVYANDGNEGLTETSFVVTVEAAVVPIAPVVSNTIADVTMPEGGTSFVRDLEVAPKVFTDGNGDVLTYTATSTDDNVASATLVGSGLTVAPLAPGSVTITVTADDGTGEPVATTTFDVTVQQVIAADPLPWTCR